MHFLQRVAIPAGHAHQVALNRGLHLLLAVLDRLHDLARLLDGDALLQRDLLAHGGTGRGSDGPERQALQRHLALHQLLLQNLGHGFQLEFVLAGQHDLIVLLVELDVGLRVLQIVALLNFLQRLLDGVVHFRQLDFGDDVESVVRHVV